MVWASRKGLVRQKKPNGNLPIEQKKCDVLYDKRQDNSQLYNTEIEKIAQNLSLPAALSKIAKMCSVCNRPQKMKNPPDPLKNNQIPKILEKIDESRRQKKKKVCVPPSPLCILGANLAQATKLIRGRNFCPLLFSYACSRDPRKYYLGYGNFSKVGH